MIQGLKDQFYFLTAEQVRELAKSDPLIQVCVRCGAGRFLTAAQSVDHFISIIERDNKDYVRDVFIPVALLDKILPDRAK